MVELEKQLVALRAQRASDTKQVLDLLYKMGEQSARDLLNKNDDE